MAIYLGNKKVKLHLNGQQLKIAPIIPPIVGVILKDKNNLTLRTSAGEILTAKED